MVVAVFEGGINSNQEVRFTKLLNSVILFERKESDDDCSKGKGFEMNINVSVRVTLYLTNVTEFFNKSNRFIILSAELFK